MTKQKAILLARYVNGVEEEYPKNKPMTKQEIITEFEKKFIHTTDDGIKTIHCGGSIIDDINLFLFQALTEFEQAVRDEIVKETLDLFTKLKKSAEIANEPVFLYEVDIQIKHLTNLLTK